MSIEVVSISWLLWIIFYGFTSSFSIWMSFIYFSIFPPINTRSRTSSTMLNKNYNKHRRVDIFLISCFHFLWIYTQKWDQFSSVTQSCPTLCDPMNGSMPGLPVHHQLPEFTQTHVHWVSDAIRPSHSLSSPSPPAPNPSQHHSLFQWVNSSHEVAKVLEFQF